MSRIDDLINELCPDGVEYKNLGSLASVNTGSQLNKTALSKAGEYPVINGGISPSGYYHLSNTEEDTIAISQGGASAGYVNFIHTKFWAGAHCFVIKPITECIENKYLYYILKNDQDKFMNAKLGAGIPGLNRKELTNYLIPIPPLAIQQEIVNILDKFTTLEAELEAELEARKKQYKYYRDKLLTPIEVNGKWYMNGIETRWDTLDNVCQSISAGGDLPQKYNKGQTSPSDDFPYPIYSNGTEEKALYGYTDGYKINTEAITISARGTIGYHAVRKPHFTPIIRLITLIPKKTCVIAKYLNYALDITIIGSSGGSIPQLTVPNVKKISIPIPPLEEQERIVSILEKFDALVSDISVGLPAEIEARKKQYEYYRNKLLTFKNIADAQGGIDEV